MAAVVRLRQGIRALLAFSRPVNVDLAAKYLSPAQLALFRRMGRAEQQHSLNVLYDLLNEGQISLDLAVAALLHDVGKTRYPLALWMKTLAVLLGAFLPALARRWSDGDPRNPFQRGLVVAARHPQWSAEMLAATGASAETLWLVAHHQEPAEWHSTHPLGALLQRLQRADNRN
ncbi:MAG: HD domain-containing protein [Chloroflexota bacterium]|nr:MAG: hypothetical protein DIU68_06145 [Chloroflexota bacterium]